jgi:hypothetical protein
MPYSYSENYYFHQGHRFVARAAVLRYIATKDIVDAGASIGDSLVVLANHTKGRIVSYELILGTYRQALRWKDVNCVILNVGLADRVSRPAAPKDSLVTRFPDFCHSFVECR